MGQPDSVSVVPALVGLAVPQAHDRALDAHLLAVDQDPGHHSSAGVVTAQYPTPGSRRRVGERVMIWADDPDDGGGDGGGNQPVLGGPPPVVGAGTK